ncbi:phospholipase D family protein [Halovivax gelatinilyticus]|uniref:phospholipase D family protein n=1 Tax=Halovivax gelatinilyticus TaxID=2961597 RepID=UPI0020CA45EC|nr:phospholipase D family protein [Halovivax gelatinilyticus]
MSAATVESNVQLLGSDAGGRRVQDSLSDIFAGDGTVYIVSGYFTYQGYRTIRDDVVSFLDRSPENELVVVVGPASDQFSARIAYDLWNLDRDGQVRLYKQPRGLHAKLYVRDGPEPTMYLGSANITQVAFEYNVELGLELTRESPGHPDLKPALEWCGDLVAASTPLRRRDLIGPVQVGSSFVNWSNKARLLPLRNVALRVLPVVLSIFVLSMLFRFI